MTGQLREGCVGDPSGGSTESGSETQWRGASFGMAFQLGVRVRFPPETPPSDSCRCLHGCLLGPLISCPLQITSAAHAGGCDHHNAACSRSRFSQSAVVSPCRSHHLAHRSAAQGAAAWNTAQRVASVETAPASMHVGSILVSACNFGRFLANISRGTPNIGFVAE